MHGDALQEVDRKIYNYELIPKHGSGATADRLRGNQKWSLPTWHSRMEFIFPYGVYALPNSRYDGEDLPVTFLEPEDEPPAKVVAVPKTQTTPRLIAEEPTCMQYMQQAVMRELVPLLESTDAGWFVGFTEQWPNQALAQIGSEDGTLATLDLSEASDRVANWLVEDLFAEYPWFLEGIQAIRSTRAQLPSGKVIHLLKYASMGSALTFPIEAMVFSAVVIERVLEHYQMPVTQSSIMKLCDTVRVYGDDIICPSETAETVIDGLEILGFRVNRAKSFWTGGFRESCGKEYYYGHDVSIVKVRKSLPTSLHDVAELVSSVSTRNQFYKAGMRRTASLFDSVLEKVLKGHYPIVAETSSVLGRIDDSIPYEVHGYRKSTQSPFVKGWVPRMPVPLNGTDDRAALLKCLLETIGEPNVDKEHLTRSGRCLTSSIKLRQAPPF